MSEIITNLDHFRKGRTYCAKRFVVAASGMTFEVAGTLCGAMNIALVFFDGAHVTANIAPEEARVLANALLHSASDVDKNCLGDNDALLMCGSRHPVREDAP